MERAYDDVVHPIERLRFVARAEGVPAEVLAVEATTALMTFADEPAALVAGCRRVLSRQLSCGPLWWACARLLTADDIRGTAIETVRALEGDTTGPALSLAIDPDADDPPALVRALAIGDGSAVAVADQLDAARDSGAPVWLVGGVGRQLCDPLWSALVEHWTLDPRRNEDLVTLSEFTHLVGPDGPVPISATRPADCPVAPELFRLAG